MEQGKPDDSSSECTNCVEKEQELVELQENVISMNSQLYNLQEKQSKMNDEDAILTQDIKARMLRLSVEENKENVRDENAQLTAVDKQFESATAAVESLKMVEKKLVSFPTAELLKHLKKRLSSAKNRKFLVNAGEVLQKYLTSDKSMEERDKARKMYEDYKKSYESFVNIYTTNIKKLEETGSLSVLIRLPKYLLPFEIETKENDQKMEEEPKKILPNCTNCEKMTEELMKLKNQLETTDWRFFALGALLTNIGHRIDILKAVENILKLQEEFKQLRCAEKVEASAALQPVEIPEEMDQKTEEKLKELKKRLEENLKKDELKHARVVLELFLSGNTHYEFYEYGWRKFKEYRKIYESFLKELKTNIQKIETNRSINGLVDIPNDPKPFAIEIESSFMQRVLKKARKPVEHGPFYAYKNLTMEEWLGKFKDLLEDTQNQQLLQNAQKTLDNYLGVNNILTAEQRCIVFNTYKGKYDEFVNILKTNIRKIENSEAKQFSDLLLVPALIQHLTAQPHPTKPEIIRFHY